MRLTVISIFLCLILSACGGPDGVVDRPGNNGTGTENGGGATPGSGSSTADDKELNDETVRFSYGDIRLAFGDPGILFTKDTDNTTASLIDIDTDNRMRFSLREGDLFFNDTNIANNVRPYKRDNAKGLTWYLGVAKTDNKPFYLVLEDY